METPMFSQIGKELRLTFPKKPLRLVRIIVVELEEPAFTFREEGEKEIVKLATLTTTLAE